MPRPEPAVGVPEAAAGIGQERPVCLGRRSDQAQVHPVTQLAGELIEFQFVLGRHQDRGDAGPVGRQQLLPQGADREHLPGEGDLAGHGDRARHGPL